MYSVTNIFHKKKNLEFRQGWSPYPAFAKINLERTSEDFQYDNVSHVWELRIASPVRNFTGIHYCKCVYMQEERDGRAISYPALNSGGGWFNSRQGGVQSWQNFSDRKRWKSRDMLVSLSRFFSESDGQSYSDSPPYRNSWTHLFYIEESVHVQK